MFYKFLVHVVENAKLAKRMANGVLNRWRSSALGNRSGVDGETTAVTAPEGTEESINGIPMPPEPTHCCNSGCPNCVWIKYAQEVTQLFDNGDVIAKKKILEKVADPKLRAYLLTQLGLDERQS